MTWIFIIFLASTSLQLVWWLGIFSKLAFYVKPEGSKEPTNQNESVSVIICAHNELSNLKQLLPALADQDYPSFEIMVVDDRSVDGTSDWIQNQPQYDHLIKVLRVTNCPAGVNPKKYALIKGIQAASFDKLLLTDADCYPLSNRWIRKMSAPLQGEIKIVLGYCGYQSYPGFLNKLIRYETLITAIQYFSRALSKRPYMGVGRNLCYRKTFFQQVEGLREVMMITGGDDDLFVNNHATANNTAVCLDPAAFMRSKPALNWTKFFRQKKRHLSVGKYYKFIDKVVLGIFSITHIIFWSSLVSLLITSTLVYWVAAGFLIRQLALSWVIEKSSRKLGEHIGLGHLALLDFSFSIFYLYTGLVAWNSRKVHWH